MEARTALNSVARSRVRRDTGAMLRETAYHGELGDVFAAHAETSNYNAYIDRPAMLELAGDVAGLRILDIGCGPGYYASALTERGATVLGIDGSAELLEHARARTGGAAELRQHDLETPLDFAADDSFDLAVCALVIHHLRGRAALLGEVFRVLKPDGHLLISTTHPAADWHHFGGSYFSQEWVELPMKHRADLAIHFQRNTIEGFVAELLAAGFALEALIEPRAVPALREVDPDAYERLNQYPSLLAARLRRPS
jgi:SAM-dependent methyltransferase